MDSTTLAFLAFTVPVWVALCAWVGLNAWRQQRERLAHDADVAALVVARLAATMTFVATVDHYDEEDGPTTTSGGGGTTSSGGGHLCCPICLDRVANVGLAPCAHRLCPVCAPRVCACPLCRAPIAGRTLHPPSSGTGAAAGAVADASSAAAAQPLAQPLAQEEHAHNAPRAHIHVPSS